MSLSDNHLFVNLCLVFLPLLGGLVTFLLGVEDVTFLLGGLLSLDPESKINNGSRFEKNIFPISVCKKN